MCSLGFGEMETSRAERCDRKTLTAEVQDAPVGASEERCRGALELLDLGGEFLGLGGIARPDEVRHRLELQSQPASKKMVKRGHPPSSEA